MSDVDYPKSHKKYEEYRNMEELSLRECHLRPFAECEGAWDKLECDEVYEAEPGAPATARITGSQAVRLVHKYIQRIKVDRFTRLTPVWVTERVEGSQQVEYLNYDIKVKADFSIYIALRNCI